MRTAFCFLIGLATVTAAGAAPARRYGIDADLKAYPQGTPKEALASVIKVVEKRRIDYLLAQLAEPEWVDRRVKGNGGDFQELVREATAKLVDDPTAVKQLRRFLQEGQWQIGEVTAVVRLKDVGDRHVYFRKIEGRWFMENRRKPETEPRDRERGKD